MSNIYDYIPSSGISPLARIIQSFAPPTSPETPEPIGTPDVGGLSRGAPTQAQPAPSGLGTLASGLGNLVKGYFAAGQPSVWGQGQPPQDSAQPAEPDTTGARDGGPGPMPLPVPHDQFPPSPIPARPDEPTTEGLPRAGGGSAIDRARREEETRKQQAALDSGTPPGPTKQPPRQEPYIRSRTDTRPSAWGKPDFALQGTLRDPRGGMAQGPFMPQPHEWPGIINSTSRNLGNLGSGVIATLARAIGMFSNEYWVAARAQQTHRAAMAAANFNLYSKQLVFQQMQENREYGAAFGAYGPHDDERGKQIKGDGAALDNAIREIAHRHQDTAVLNALDRRGPPAVERLIQGRESWGQDHGKMLTQMRLRYLAETARLKLEQEKAKLANIQAQNREWFGEGGAPVATPSTETPSETPAEPTEEAPETPETPDKTPETSEATPPETPETPESQAAKTTETPAETAETPAKTPETTGQAAVAPVTPIRKVPAAAAPERGPAPERAPDLPLAPPRINDAAQRVQMGEKIGDITPKNDAVRGAVEKQKGALDNYMHGLVDPNNGLTPDQVKARARAANPAMGDYVQNLLDGNIQLTPAASAKQSLGISLAKRIDPNWERTAQIKRDQREREDRVAQVAPIRQTLGQQEKLRSNLRDVLGKNINDMNYLLLLAKKLRDKGYETDIPAIDRHLIEAQRLWAGDPDAQAFDAQLRNVRTDIGRVFSSGAAGTGAVYPVSTQKEMREFLQPGLTLAQLERTIQVVKQDYANKLSKVTDEVNLGHNRIAQILGGKAPEPLSDDDTMRQITADQTVIRNGKFYYFYNGKWHDD